MVPSQSATNDDTKSDFRPAQASQLFINCCFALSLSGIFWILALAMDSGKGPAKFFNLVFIPLLVYLIFVVWRQYSSYYIPVQHYRRLEEPDSYELTTLLITICLSLYPVACVFARRCSPLVLLLLILLNLLKVKQIQKVIPEIPVAEYAFHTLEEFKRRLFFYSGTLVLVLYPPLLFYRAYLEKHDWLANIGYGLGPLALFLIASRFRDTYFSPVPELDSTKFVACIRSAFDYSQRPSVIILNDNPLIYPYPPNIQL